MGIMANLAGCRWYWAVLVGIGAVLGAIAPIEAARIGGTLHTRARMRSQPGFLLLGLRNIIDRSFTK